MSAAVRPPVQAVVFDFFGVICSEITPFVLPRYMSAEEAVAYKAEIVGRADLGEIQLADVLDHLSRKTGVPPARFEAEFWEFVKIDPAMVALIETVKTRTKTALLSNAICPFLRQILAKHDLERLFDRTVVSCEEHIAKPDPAIFRLMSERLGVPASACVFTDDSPGNIAAAQAAGFIAVQFTGVEPFKRDLTALGVL